MILVLAIPLIGVLIYVIARGHSMTERRAGDYRRQEEATQQYIREAAGSTSTAWLEFQSMVARGPGRGPVPRKSTWWAAPAIGG